MIEGKSGGRRKGRDRGSVSLGGRGAVRSIIPTQTPLGFRVRDSTERRRDKSLLLTFERTATYSNNLKRGGETVGGVWPSFFSVCCKGKSEPGATEETYPKSLHPSGTESIKSVLKGETKFILSS